MVSSLGGLEMVGPGGGECLFYRYEKLSKGKSSRRAKCVRRRFGSAIFRSSRSYENVTGARWLL